MRLPCIAVAVTLLATSLAAADRRVDINIDRSSGRPLYRVTATKAPLAVVAKEIAAVSGRTIEVEPASRNVAISVAIADASEERMLETVAAEANLWSVRRANVVRFQTSEPTATIDVKDEDVRSILKSMQAQCGVRNLVIDPNVQGKGTFLFRDVPCRQAFSVVFSTFGLKGDFAGRSVGTIAPRR